MANWSETIIEIKGNTKDIEKAGKLLKSYIEDSYFCIEDNKDKLYKDFSEFKEYIDSLDEVSFRAGFSSMEINNFKIEEDSILITGSGRWCSPSVFFKLITEKYNLSMTYCDAEEGCNFCYVIEMENGEVKDEKENEYYSPDLVKYLMNGEIADFIDGNGWYFNENIKKIDNIDNLLKTYGTSREAIMAS